MKRTRAKVLPHFHLLYIVAGSHFTSPVKSVDIVGCVLECKLNDMIAFQNGQKVKSGNVLQNLEFVPIAFTLGPIQDEAL